MWGVGSRECETRARVRQSLCEVGGVYYLPTRVSLFPPHLPAFAVIETKVRSKVETDGLLLPQQGHLLEWLHFKAKALGRNLPLPGQL